VRTLALTLVALVILVVASMSFGFLPALVLISIAATAIILATFAVMMAPRNEG